MFWRGQQPLSHDKLYLKGLFKIWVGRKKKKPNITKGIHRLVSFQCTCKPTAGKVKTHARLQLKLSVFVRPNKKETNVELCAEMMNDPKELEELFLPCWWSYAQETSHVRRRWLLTGFVHRSVSHQCGTNQSCACVAIIIIFESLWFLALYSIINII